MSLYVNELKELYSQTDPILSESYQLDGLPLQRLGWEDFCRFH
jgi:hypothetical protein